jgi:hypothetical protein
MLSRAEHLFLLLPCAALARERLAARQGTGFDICALERVVNRTQQTPQFTKIGQITPAAPDPSSTKGQTSYYYVRVLQTKGQIAWARPMWVTQQ